jgi:hypothetical protein
VFLFLLLGLLLLLAAGGSAVDVVIFVGRSEIFCAGDALGPSYKANTAAAGGIVALVYKIGKCISYSLFRSAIGIILFPIYNIYSKNFQSNVHLWERTSINAIKLVPNVSTWRTSINTNLLENSIMLIAIVRNNILFLASINSDSQILYVVNQTFS